MGENGARRNPARILGRVMTQEEIRRRLDGDRLRRLGAALWFRLGTALRLQDLDWAVALLGEGGDRLLWEELRAAEVLDRENRLRPRPLARWLDSLVKEEEGEERMPQLVWTLPETHPAASELGSTYLKAILETVEAARRELVMTSPFLQEKGIMEILRAVVRALKRGVRLIVLTHAADNLASNQSVALEAIRQEAERIRGQLIVYSAPVMEGGLLHAKLVIADEERMVLGSANLTGPGLTSNLEAGVVLGCKEARLAMQIMRGLVETNIATKVFSTM